VEGDAIDNTQKIVSIRNDVDDLAEAIEKLENEDISVTR
jgi:hypothetical protein